MVVSMMSQEDVYDKAIVNLCSSTAIFKWIMVVHVQCSLIVQTKHPSPLLPH